MPAAPARTALEFPADLGARVGRVGLLRCVAEAARHVNGRSWSHLAADLPPVDTEPDPLLIFLCYGYLSGVYASGELVRRLDADDALAGLRARLDVDAGAVRRFRRRQRPALCDCLTHALVEIAFATGAALPEDETVEFRRGDRPAPGPSLKRLEPYYREARARLERAVIADSTALDV
jgi:hypothetical protein